MRLRVRVRVRARVNEDDALLGGATATAWGVWVGEGWGAWVGEGWGGQGVDALLLDGVCGGAVQVQVQVQVQVWLWLCR